MTIYILSTVALIYFVTVTKLNYIIFINIPSEYTQLQVGGDSCGSQFLSGVTAYYSPCTSLSQTVSLKVSITPSKN